MFFTKVQCATLRIFFLTLGLVACTSSSDDTQTSSNRAVMQKMTTTSSDPGQIAERLATVNTTWQLQFEKPATAEETLRILGNQDKTVEEILFQLPYGNMAGGGTVKHGNIKDTLQQVVGNYKKMFVELVYPTDEQLTENAKNSIEATRSIASMRQIKADDEANLRYMETHGVLISAVRFKVLSGQEKAFLARWSAPISAYLTHFKITHPLTGRIVIPLFVN